MGCLLPVVIMFHCNPGKELTSFHAKYFFRWNKGKYCTLKKKSIEQGLVGENQGWNNICKHY